MCAKSVIYKNLKYVTVNLFLVYELIVPSMSILISYLFLSIYSFLSFLLTVFLSLYRSPLILFSPSLILSLFFIIILSFHEISPIGIHTP